ncbi:hypothetical protein AK812_SmicGene25719, partial [Symbiodinium microadriaticum]
MEASCRNATEEPSEANLVRLLDLWSMEWKHQMRTRVVGPGAFEKYCTLGFFGHGGVCGVSNATGERAGCTAVNHFLKSRFPNGTWTSIAVRVWIEDDEGDSAAWLATKKGERELRGRWLDMHDKPSFDARRYHMVEPHEGNMWALAAYVPQAYGRATEQHQASFRDMGQNSALRRPTNRFLVARKPLPNSSHAYKSLLVQQSAVLVELFRYRFTCQLDQDCTLL